MGLLDKLSAAVAWATRGAYGKTSEISQPDDGAEENEASRQDDGSAFDYCALSPDQMDELRALYASAKDMCAMLDQSGVCESMGYPDRTLEELFENDMVRYLIYLSARDGELAKAEVEFMNTIFGCERTVGEWTIRGIRLGVTSPSVATDVPLSFQVLAQVGARCGVDAGEVIVPVFDRLAAALAVADGEEVDEERDSSAAYLALLMQYLESGESDLVQPGYPVFLTK